MKRIVNPFRKVKWGTRAYAVFLLCAATAATLPAQTFATLFNFEYTNGAYPNATLVQGADGDLYGTTVSGGAGSSGTVFKITTSGTEKTLYSFCSQSGCADGAGPESGLVQAIDGGLYGTTSDGGAHGGGTVFKITSNGTLTTLYSFCSQTGCTDGEYPYAGLLQATNGDFYGTTFSGGASNDGAVFRITPGGSLTTLYSFCSQTRCADGANPYAALVQATNGNLYGTTYSGGAGSAGTVFKITTSGTLTPLYSFCSQRGCTDGERPYAGLVQTTNGDFYGTTTQSGESDNSGTVFKITPGGALTTLYRFCSESGCTGGWDPVAGLLRATDGDFYGTTLYGGANGHGTIFEITPGGTLTTRYSFCSQGSYPNCIDGFAPSGGLVQATNGDLYGTASDFGIDSSFYGSVFSLSGGLGPFVETLPTSGKVGAVVRILGTNLTGVSSVTFNGTPAVIRAFSSSITELTTTVPAGASGGIVQVVTSSGTLSSNVPFRVLP